MTDQHARSALDWVSLLNLQPHPEGGHFRETYRSRDTLAPGALPERFAPGLRACSTSIIYLLEQGDYSAFHRIKSDELWHHYAGGPLDIHMLDNNGGHAIETLGRDILRGEQLQVVVPAGTWFAAAPQRGAPYVLAGCTVSPGFDFADFEMASEEQLRGAAPLQAATLLAQFPPRRL